MFTLKLKNPKLGRVSFAGVKSLINKQFKYRSLGEMVALARATGERPLPTRNGVYTGDLSIPTDTFEKINARNKLMDDILVAEGQYSEAMSKLAAEKKVADEAQFREQVIKEYESSRKESTTK